MESDLPCFGKTCNIRKLTLTTDGYRNEISIAICSYRDEISYMVIEMKFYCMKFWTQSVYQNPAVRLIGNTITPKRNAVEG